MKKIDYKKEWKTFYTAPAKQPVIVDVPQLSYLSVDGIGDPNTSAAYRNAVEALFSLAYTIKFAIKKGPKETDYGVMPLEGLWWMDDMRQFTLARKDEWKWTMMIVQPPMVTIAIVNASRAALAKKKELPSLATVKFDAFKEGKAAQILHVGPFTNEGPTIQRLHEFIKTSKCELTGKHHEIYLSDIRRAQPTKWKTIIRQPMISPPRD